MKTNHEFITRGEEVFLLTEDTKTISLPQAVGNVAMSVYANLEDLTRETDADEMKRLEKKILLQSKVLNALSNACEATKHIK
ncbi:hypothetical protein [Turicimonas muris]|uniref:hypothetical protein n=1 Tax=Turicimonas muris TaxID=1796652 RepID=UPI002675D942|nr:hypothetical protein [Turicimonas muris]